MHNYDGTEQKTPATSSQDPTDPPKKHRFPFINMRAGIGASSDAKISLMAGATFNWPIFLKDENIVHFGIKVDRLINNGGYGLRAGFATVGYSYGPIKATGGIGVMERSLGATKEAKEYPIGLFDHFNAPSLAIHAGIEAVLEPKHNTSFAIEFAVPIHARSVAFSDPQRTYSGDANLPVRYGQVSSISPLKPQYTMRVTTNFYTFLQDKSAKLSAFIEASTTDTPYISHEITILNSADPSIVEGFKQVTEGRKKWDITAGVVLSIPHPKKQVEALQNPLDDPSLDTPLLQSEGKGR